MSVAEPRVALVAMPWPGLGEPSLGLATLKAQLNAADVHARVHHLYIGLLRHLRPETYDAFSRMLGLNEFLFTSVLDDLDETQLDCLLDVCADPEGTRPNARYRTPVELAEAAIRVRNEVVPVYLEECADVVLADDPTLVGFTCMFDQTVASVALAQVLRRREPDLMIVAGGYALFGEPGLEVLRTFPQLDSIVQGDGEPAIYRLSLASVGEDDLALIPNVVTRNAPGPAHPALADLAAAPTPDFDDWFADVAALEQQDQVTITTRSLPLEGSRGCWWGQTSHCTFCGIDEESLQYRIKPAAVVLDTIRELRNRYGDVELRFSDYILARDHYRDLLPVLALEQPRFRLSCEIKANQSPARMEALAEAGFVELQPGIESFSSEQLREMSKGVRAIQNVATLKLGYLHGMVIHYNVLFGFPHEELKWFQDLFAAIPAIYHLTPPISRSLVQITRFAPLQADPTRFGIAVRALHDWRYDVMFSRAFLERTGMSLDDYVYCFERTFDTSPELKEAHRILVHQIEHWKNQHRVRDVELSYEPTDTGGRFIDSRFGPSVTIDVDAPTWRVYQEVDGSPRAISEVRRTLGLDGIDEATVDSALELLVTARLVWQEGRQALGLAVPIEISRAHAESNWKAAWISLRE